MCVILEADFIVGLTVRDKSVINSLFHLNDGIEFSIKDCLKKQQICKTSGYGNVIAVSTENDFINYLRRNGGYFSLQPNGNYRVVCENLEDENGKIDYERFLTVGKYNGSVYNAFNYPRNIQTIN